MFRKITNGILGGVKKFLTMERLIVLVVFLVLMYALVMYSNNKVNVKDNMETGKEDEEKKEGEKKADDVKPAEQKKADGYSTKEVANPKDLLPSDANSQWAALNPNTTQENLSADLLKAGQHIGVDTVGQSLRNANLQLRSDPMIPKADVGPWNHSTIEADHARVPLELGA